MEKESQSARQQDTNKLKEGLWEFFAHDDVDVPAVPRDKTGRGFNHIGTARALCPRAYIWDFDNDERYVSLIFFYLLTLPLVFSRRSQVGKLRSRLISSQTSSMMSARPTHLQEMRIGMSRMDYYVQSFVCGYVTQFFKSIRAHFIYIQAYKCIFMGNGFYSPLERKKKSAVGKINGLTQVTPSTLAYTIAQVCFYSIFVQLS